MSGCMTKSIIKCLGVFALVLGLSAPALAAPPASNPGQPFEEILGAIGILNDKLDDLQNDVDKLPGALGPCEVPPVWGKKFAGADRFVAVLDGAAYCDQETGLVWEGSPAITGGPNNDGTRTWTSAISHCANREVDGRKGWELPLRNQLASLVDSSNTDPSLPTGHPFSGVQSAVYWSASTIAGNPADAWVLDFGGGFVGGNKVGLRHRAWCVRGGQSFDGNTHNTLH